jgi:hypothetical protein
VKAIARNKLTKKLLMLFVLIGVFTYLRQPGKAHAIYYCACEVGCVSQWSQCNAKCNGNKTCLASCQNVLNECNAFCAKGDPSCECPEGDPNC